MNFVQAVVTVSQPGMVGKRGSGFADTEKPLGVYASPRILVYRIVVPMRVASVVAPNFSLLDTTT